MEKVTLKDFIKRWDLEYLTPGLDPLEFEITVPEVNRPALQLAGFYEYFDHTRVQIMGNGEYYYLAQFTEQAVLERYEGLFRAAKGNMPVIVFCRGLRPADEVCRLAEQYRIPLVMTGRKTGEFSSELILWLKKRLAPTIRTHGVLVDVFGIGVMITGDSGIGKSEAALELVKRGHRLVADDAVDIRKISDERLVGSSPAMIKDLLELRGIGIIDVKMMYGIGAVSDSADIDLVIHLEEWDKSKEYERFGSATKTIEFLGNRVERYDMPLRPGRNLAIIVETAAMNHRMMKMGYDAGGDLIDRISAQFEKNE